MSMEADPLSQRLDHGRIARGVGYGADGSLTVDDGNGNVVQMDGDGGMSVHNADGQSSTMKDGNMEVSDGKGNTITQDGNTGDSDGNGSTSTPGVGDGGGGSGGTNGGSGSGNNGGQSSGQTPPSGETSTSSVSSDPHIAGGGSTSQNAGDVFQESPSETLPLAAVSSGSRIVSSGSGTAARPTSAAFVSTRQVSSDTRATISRETSTSTSAPILPSGSSSSLRVLIPAIIIPILLLLLIAALLLYRRRRHVLRARPSATNCLPFLEASTSSRLLSGTRKGHSSRSQSAGRRETLVGSFVPAAPSKPLPTHSRISESPFADFLASNFSPYRLSTAGHSIQTHAVTESDLLPQSEGLDSGATVLPAYEDLSSRGHGNAAGEMCEKRDANFET